MSIDGKEPITIIVDDPVEPTPPAPLTLDWLGWTMLASQVLNLILFVALFSFRDIRWIFFAGGCASTVGLIVWAIVKEKNT